MSKRITIPCGQCGTPFSSYPSQKQKYCSNECRYAAPHAVPHAGAHLNPDHFWSFVEKTDGCWLWNGHRKANGYGHISVNSKLKLAHRHAWELTNGPIPEGKFCLHHCDNPPCVRPDHLYIGTKSDNALDRERRGRGYNQRRRAIHAA